MIAFRIGVVLTILVVVLGSVWGIGGYFANRGTDVAGLGAAAAIFFGGIAIAVIWLCVFVTYVIGMGVRLFSDGKRT